MPIIEYEIILPDGPIIDLPELKRRLLRTLQKEADAIDANYKLFYGPWDGEKPTMPKKAEVTDKEAYAEVATQGETHGNKKLEWADDGRVGRESECSE